MKPLFKAKLQYRLEKYLNKGGSSIFVSLFFGFIVSFLLIIFIRWLILLILPELTHTNSFFDDIWFTWLMMTDPGNMSLDNLSPIWFKIITIISGVVGVIILSILIAFITTSLEKEFYNFRKGRGKVFEENFTLILGWNERVIDVIRELILANESEKYAAVVVLSNESKEKMDDLITKRIPNSKTTRIITTTGDYANINELKRINVTQAKSVILLSGCSENSFEEEKLMSDALQIKAIMAISACQNGKNKLPIIAEIFYNDKRELISFFQDENIIALDSWKIMGKLLVQTSLTSGLEMVYNEILSFYGCEIYFYKADWSQIKFGSLVFHFNDGIPLGVYNENDGMTLRPDEDYEMKKEDQVIILADDDSTINFEKSVIYKPKKLKFKNEKLNQKKKSVLILGWHNVAEIFIDESSDYLLKDSSFDIYFNKPSKMLIDKITRLKQLYPSFNINLIDKNPLKLKTIEESNAFDYDNIIVLSQNLNEQSPDKIDSDTLMILLLLRRIKNKIKNKKTKIITQVLNSENQEIITQTDVDDFIICNKLITMILAQLSESPLLLKFYEDIFSEDGSEIYVKAISLYHDSFPLKTTFGNLIKLTEQRNEICLGIRKEKESKNAAVNFGVILNLPKDKVLTMQKEDCLVVLSEDEL